MMGSGGGDDGKLGALAALIADPDAAQERISSLQEATHNFEFHRDQALANVKSAEAAKAAAVEAEKSAEVAWSKANSKNEEAKANAAHAQKRKEELVAATRHYEEVAGRRYEDIDAREQAAKVASLEFEQQVAKQNAIQAAREEAMKKREAAVLQAITEADKIVNDYNAKLSQLRRIVA